MSQIFHSLPGGRAEARPSVLRPKASAGFTLVELLVVIAIISILAGLLLPALRETLWTANKVVSVNQMHQLHTLLTLYADDNEGELPNAPRLDQGCDYWTNFYIIDYHATPKQLVRDTLGHTLVPYIDDARILMAPNHWGRITQTYKDHAGGMWTYWYGYYWRADYPWFRTVSYAYLPMTNIGAKHPNTRIGRGLEGIPYSRLSLLQEVVARPSRDQDNTDRHKSANWRDTSPEGGNVLWGGGGVTWVPAAAHFRTMQDTYYGGGSTYTLQHILYKQ